MLAVIETGGKQYMIEENSVISIEKTEGLPGDEISFDKVLLLADKASSYLEVGKPYIENKIIKATILEQGKAKKIRVVKYKRKVRYTRVSGHRQPFTKVKITTI